MTAYSAMSWPRSSWISPDRFLTVAPLRSGYVSLGAGMTPPPEEGDELTQANDTPCSARVNPVFPAFGGRVKLVGSEVPNRFRQLVPPATVMRVTPRSVCFQFTDHRQRPSFRTPLPPPSKVRLLHLLQRTRNIRESIVRVGATKRTVPATSTWRVASITAYSAISCPRLSPTNRDRNFTGCSLSVG
jgi:hypothetical protein